MAVEYFQLARVESPIAVELSQTALEFDHIAVE
jgi:hypothetical protein